MRFEGREEVEGPIKEERERERWRMLMTVFAFYLRFQGYFETVQNIKERERERKGFPKK